MTPQHAIAAYISRRPALAAAIYLILSTSLIAMASVMSISLAESLRARNASLERLGQIEQRGIRPAGQQSSSEAWPSGSPLVEGSTVTIAGAALLQRISVAITQAHGSLDSSELEAPDPNKKDNFIKATASFEIQQIALQNVLYDIEAGMPFLFVEQLWINPVSNDSGKLRVVARVSGRWSGAN